MDKIKENQITIIDDFLPLDEFSKLSNLFTSPGFPWYYKDNITFSTVSNKELGSFGFEHCFVVNGIMNSNFCQNLSVVLNHVATTTNTTKNISVRADMTTYSKDSYLHQPHVDRLCDHIVSIFYVTDSSSETIIFDGNPKENNLKTKHIVYPKANRLLTFNGKYFHTGKSPCDTKIRILLNINSI